MAINILNTPQLFSSSNSNNIFVWNSNLENISYYIVTILNAQSNAVILTTNVYPTPFFIDNKCYLNINKVIENLVKYQFIEYNSDINYFIDSLIGYTIRIDEVLIDNTIIQNPVSNVFYVFNANLDLVSSKYFNYKNYTLDVTNNNLIDFITTKKDKIFTNDKSDEGLYFLNYNYSSIKVNIIALYDSTNNYLGNDSGSFIKTDNNNFIQLQINYPIQIQTNSLRLLSLNRINTSLQYLINNHNLPIIGLKQYSVSISDSNDNILSNTFTYLVEESYCKYDYLNVYFENKFGVTETLNLLNPQFVTNSENKLTGIFNNYSYSDDNINYYDGNVFNESEIVLNNVYSTTITAYTKNFDDKDFGFLNDLITSKKIHLKINNDYITVICQSNSINLSKKLKKGNQNVIDLVFKTDSNFTNFNLNNN